MQTTNPFRPLVTLMAKTLGWTPSSYFMLSVFFILLFVIGVVWWPLVEANLAIIDWSQPLWIEIIRKMDWLLLFDFVVMTLLIMARADLKSDALIVAVGFAGGLVIESWGTQTHLWNYFTLERPPLWIIPAWPIASLSIDRLYRFLDRLRIFNIPYSAFRILYWLLFLSFYALMLRFVWPTLDKSLTLAALALCALLILSPTDHRAAVLTFVAGSSLGYFLELWGTTRACWIYYTFETPPLFAVLAHGMAAVAFWRVVLLTKAWTQRIVNPPSTSRS
ncbi:MAG: hypothetical protein FJ030_06040 [Chloroflexi bacterium]|nr:hypothetical protein [Chloroflexota bacterium]